MNQNRAFDAKRRYSKIWTTLFIGLVVSAGCDFDAIGEGMPPGLGCSRDLSLDSIWIDLTPPVEGFVLGGANPAPSNSEFLEFDHAFAIEWAFAYDGVILPGPGKRDYATLIQILSNEEIVWETTIGAEPIDIGDEGTDYVVVSDGLPIGFYQLRVELDVYGEVPECDGLVETVNNARTMDFSVWGSSGPPQNPTPCEESEDPNCVDSDGADQQDANNGDGARR